MLPIDHFYRAVAKYPDRIAVKDGDVEVTYAELGQSVAALAAAFQNIDPSPQTRSRDLRL